MTDEEIVHRLEDIDLTPAAISWMKRNWGPKCDEFEPECPCCKAWHIFETTGERKTKL